MPIYVNKLAKIFQVFLYRLYIFNYNINIVSNIEKDILLTALSHRYKRRGMLFVPSSMPIAIKSVGNMLRLPV